MTPEELDEARAKEAHRRLFDSRQPYFTDDIAVLAARFAREGRTPPEPVVDPDILAFREYFAERNPEFREGILKGGWDHITAAQAFLAGARMAREQGEKARKREALRELTKLTEEYGGYEELRGINEEGWR